VREQLESAFSEVCVPEAMLNGSTARRVERERADGGRLG